MWTCDNEGRVRRALRSADFRLGVLVGSGFRAAISRVAVAAGLGEVIVRVVKVWLRGRREGAGSVRWKWWRLSLGHWQCWTSICDCCVVD